MQRERGGELNPTARFFFAHTVSAALVLLVHCMVLGLATLEVGPHLVSLTVDITVFRQFLFHLLEFLLFLKNFLHFLNLSKFNKSNKSRS